MKRSNIYILLAAALFILGLLLPFLLFQGARPGDGDGAGVVPVRPAVPAGQDGTAPDVAGSDSEKEPVNTSVTGNSAGQTPDNGTAPATEPQKEPQADPSEFTREDAKHAQDKVTVDLGSYEVSVGEEFDVSIELFSPALENLVLYMEFDPAKLSVVPQSGRRVGEAFQQEIEFYTRVQQGKGQAVIISATRPGSKNVNPTAGEVVALFRMRAREAGESTLEFENKHISFTNAVGTDIEEYEILGGTVTAK